MSLCGPESSVLMTPHPEGDEIPCGEEEDHRRISSSDNCKATAIEEEYDAFYAQETLHSLIEKEKQISVDPISLKQSTKTGDRMPSGATAAVTPMSAKMLAALALLPAKPKFLSASLPCSGTSSPRSGLAVGKNRKKSTKQSLVSLSISSLARQHSDVLSRLSHEPKGLRKSKSCGEGRACPPSDEFDLCLRKLDSPHEDNREDDYYKRNAFEAATKKSDPYDEGFKCGALCLFLPGLTGKAKQVKPKRDDDENVISRVVSLEKFECGSWSSSAIMNDDEGDEGMHLYFDLPLELIKNSTNDANSPVTTAFVFDNDRKGGLKKNTSRKSHESARHVRFSTSAPVSYPSSPSSSCITPRLRKAREEFNAYLEEAQRA
ncbi:uncharacterized protein LOC131241229 [Magnolia sinica]|uniref:uncharacterized protein LOC131241229 n=1 Tax=Magnolia sinica TaxID=86752 RepID=UPI00265ADC2B|nr:uncharacterized protein LOC131241229 [Magnolia sinica]